MTEWLFPLFLEPYQAINEYRQVIEGRAPDPLNPSKNYAHMKSGDVIRFRAIDEETFEPLEGYPDMLYQVVFVHLYRDETPEGAIQAMLEKEGWENLGYKSLDAGIRGYMSFPRYPERIREHGIYAIGLGQRIDEN